MRSLFTFVLVALAAIAVPSFAQEKTEGPSHSQGYVEDWSSHHVVFSNPGTEQEARQRGEYDKWLRIVNDERYMMQRRRRSAPPRWGGWGHDESSIKRDWSMLLGTSIAANATGTFSGEPDSTSSLTITAGVGTIKLSAATTGTGTCVLSTGTTYTGSFTRSATASTDAANLVSLVNTAGCGNLVGVTATQGTGIHTNQFTITATGAGAGEIGSGATDSIQLTSTTGTGTNFDLATTWTNTALTGSTGINPNTYPAKYNENYAGEAPSCSDFIVYPTGVAGSSSQAEVIGYTNLYKTTCTSNSGPTVAFAYNTGGGTATLSPVLSSDGKQIAYIQVSSGVASLVLLRPSLTSGSTVTTPTLAATAAAYYNSGSGCTAPCYYSITLNGSPNDTNSSPFYTYTSTVSDTIFVGDDSGKLHKFSPVFSGAPAEVTTNWPATASTSTNPKLTSPVYDGGTSQLVFVGDATGYLNSVTAGVSPGATKTSEQMECGSFGFVDPPVVDSSAEYVYMFIGDGCSDGTAPVFSSYINVFAAGTSINASYGHNNAQFNNQATNDIGTVQYHGIFDNAYYEGSGNTGNLYACVNGALYQFAMAELSTTTQVTHTSSPGYSLYNTPASTVSDAASCSALTEYCNNGSSACTVSGGVTNHGTDYLFLSLEANGSTVNLVSCTAGCIYNYTITSGATTGTPSDALQAAGGTGSIVIDNSGSATGESQVYYGTLSSQTCAGNGTVGNGSGSCAVQASQSGLQ
jgi:hypothetical protein